MRLKRNLGIWGFIAAASLFSQTGNTGERLHFRSGSVDPKLTNEVNRFLPATLSASEAISHENFVVQFKTKIKSEDQELLAARGLKVVSYIPDDAYLVSGSSDAIRGLEQEVRVAAVVPMISTWKVSPDFAPRSVFTAAQNERVMVQLREDADQNEFLSQVASASGMKVLSAQGKVAVLDVQSGAIDRLAALEPVVWVEPFVQMQILPMDVGVLAEPVDTFKGDYTDLTGFESGTKVMKFEKAWERGFTGAGEKVSMADTGLDSGKLETLYADFGSIKKGYSFGLYAEGWDDPMGHGTHVAGSVMGSGKGNTGVLRGGAYQSEMIPEGMWSPVLNNLTVPPKLESLFKPAYDDGARVHTNSWGGAREFGTYDNYAVQVDEFMWKNPDMLIVFAAGNSGVDGNKDGRIDENSMASPGTAKNVLTVGASENYVLKGGIQKKLGELLDGQPWGIEPLKSDTLSNNPDGLAAFSSRGPTKDQRIKPEVVAPGTNIVSNCSHVSGASPLWGKYNDNYCFSGGTSMSTPLVAGAAVVTREYLKKTWNIAEPSAAVVKAVLMGTADDLFPGQYGAIGKSAGQEILTKGPNSDQGYGRVNMDNATQAKSSGYFVKVVDDKVGVAANKALKMKLTSKQLRRLAGKTLKATLVYTDAPGAPNAAKSLVNDLDLVVTLADGKQLKSTSRVNNHEQVVVENLPNSGDVSIAVVGVSIPQSKNGKLPFALVVTEN